MKTSISSPLANSKCAKFAMTASVSTLSLMMAASLSSVADAQIIIQDGDNSTVTSQAPGDVIIVDPGVSTTVDGMPIVVFANDDVTLDNSGTISTLGVTQTVQINAGTSGGTVLNNETGIIQADSRAINIDGQDVLIVNDGQILGTGDQRNGTVYGNLSSNNITLLNSETGVIDAGAGNNGAGVALQLNEDDLVDATIDNAGIIQGRGQAAATCGTAGDGIRLFQVGSTFIGTITNADTGIINSESTVGTVAGVRIADGVNFQGTLDNDGTISGAQNGVYFGNGDHTGGVVTNTGVISSDSRAFNIDGTGLTLVNVGDIVGTGNQRNGTVYADGTADDFTVINEGVIDAGAGNEGSGFGVEIGGAADGANTFTLENAGTIQGRGNAAAGTNAAGDGVRIGNPGNTGLTDATITNSGDINSEGANGTVAGLRVVDGVGFQGTLDNDGTISGVQNGVYFGNGDHTGGVVTNTGVISSDSRAFNIDGTGLTVTNSGDILGTDSQRNGTVYADGTADDFTVINEGVIDAGAGNEGSGFGVEIGGADDGANTFVLDNSGTIQGRGNAAAGTNAAGDGVRIGNPGNTGLTDATITNSGDINSEGANGTVAGLRVVDGVGFQGTLDNDGTISGVQNGVYFGNGDHTGGVVTNTGTISSDSRAFNIDGTGLTVTNSGDILGTDSQRNGTVYADGTADDFTFVNEGVIDAGAGNEGSGFGAEIGGAADGANTFTLDNSGLIQGRGNAAAGTNAAGDGVRIGNPGNTGLTDATITNSGDINSEGANGTVAGLRVVDGVGFQGTLDNDGTISGVQNGVYFGNGDHTGGVVTNTESGIISSDSRAFNIDGTGLTVINNGLIVGTGDQRNGTLYADGTAQNFTVINSETGLIDADSGIGSGFAAEIGADGNTFTVQNAGVILGRGQGSATTGAAGDGLRIGNPGNAGIANATVTNSGLISSESNVGTVAGLRVVDGVGFQGTLVNTEDGLITGVRNGVYFGNADHTGGVVTNAGEISSDSRAFNVDGIGLTINNSGDILATGDQRNGTFYADSTAQDFTLNNLETGTIDAGDGLNGAAISVELSEAGNDFVINNDGVIQGRGNAAAGLTTAGDGIRFERSRNMGALDGTTTGLFTGTINNNAGGLINSESDNGTTAGIRFVNGTSFQGTINNAGTISGVQNGVYFGNPTPAGGGDHTGGVFNNLADGVVSSDSRAFNIDGLGLTLNNAGTIVGTGDQRNGTVYSDGTATDFTVVNSGTIDAGEGNDGSGFAAEIGADGNTFTFDNSGTVQGRGQGAFSDGFRVGNAGNIGVATVDITNSGLINSESTGSGAVSGLRFVNGVSFDGVINNSGTISGAQNGVYFGNAVMGQGADHSNGVFNNLADGVVSSDSRAFNIDGLGLTLNNAGTIVGTGDQRNGTVYSDGTATDFTVLNSGTIDAGAGNDGSGFAAEIGADGNTFTFDNSGTVQGRGQGAFSDGFRVGNAGNIGVATVDITNSGLINSESTGSGAVSGLRFVNGVSFDGVINNSGTISGAQNGVYFGNAVMGQGADHSNGVFNNLAGGVVSSDSRAFNIDGTGLTVNNSGSIIGTGDQRNGTVYSDATADNYTFNNLSLGLVDAGAGNNGSGLSLQSGDVAGDDVTLTVNNAGSIIGRGDALPSGQAAGLRVFGGASDVTVNGDIINSGLISSETAAAILIENVDFAGTITNSGQLVGINVFDGSAALGAVTFNQIGGAFNTNFIGSSFADALSLGGTNFGLNADILGNVTTTVESGTTVAVNGVRALEGNFIQNGALNLTLGADVLNVTGDTTFNAGSAINIAPNVSIGDLTVGQTIELVTRTGAFTDNGLVVNLDENDFLVDYIVGLNSSSTSSVNVTVAAADLGAVSDDTNVSALGAGITSAFSAGALSVEAANFFNNQASVSNFEEASIALLPALNEGISREIWETNKRNFGFINRRLSSESVNGLWGEASIRASERDTESGSVTGYESDVNSFAVGVDRQFTDAFRGGLVVTYSEFNIETDLVSTDETDLQTTQVSVYGGYDAGNIFVNGQAGYIFGDGESQRSTGLGDVTGTFDVDGITVQGAAGYNYKLGALNLAPQVGLRYGNVSQDAFTEVGALNLTVDANDVNFFEGTVGARASADFGSTESWAFRPSVTANYVYDFAGEARDVNITVPGATAQLATSGDPAGSRFEIGANLDWITNSGLSVGVGYEGDFASRYSSNAGVLRFRYGF